MSLNFTIHISNNSVPTYNANICVCYSWYNENHTLKRTRLWKRSDINGDADFEAVENEINLNSFVLDAFDDITLLHCRKSFNIVESGEIINADFSNEIYSESGFTVSVPYYYFAGYDIFYKFITNNYVGVDGGTSRLMISGATTNVWTTIASSTTCCFIIESGTTLYGSYLRLSYEQDNETYQYQYGNNSNIAGGNVYVLCCYPVGIGGGGTMSSLAKSLYEIEIPCVNDTINWHEDKTLFNTYFCVNYSINSSTTRTFSGTTNNNYFLHSHSNASLFSKIYFITPSANTITVCKNHYMDSLSNVSISANSVSNILSGGTFHDVRFFLVLSGKTENEPIIIQREPNVCMINQDLYDYATSLVPELGLDSGVTDSSYSYNYEKERVGASFLDYYRFWCDSVGVNPSAINSLPDFKNNFISAISTSFVSTNYALNQSVEDQYILNSRHGYVWDRCFLPMSSETPTRELEFLIEPQTKASSCTISFNINTDIPFEDLHIYEFEYTTDGNNWNSYTFNNGRGLEIELSENGNRFVKFRRRLSDTSSGLSTSAICYHFETTGNCYTRGSITSLLDGIGINNNIQIEPYCFNCLFATCGIINSPILNEVLSDYCYASMFVGSSLEIPPELPSTILYEGCYLCMFVDCHSLLRAPILPALNLVYRCYDSMFENCELINFINASFITDFSNTAAYTQNWLYGVSEYGTFVRNEDALWPENIQRGPDTIPVNWNIMSQQEYENYVDFELSSGTLWAKKNLGANSVTDPGLWFAWGDISGYTNNDIGTMKNFTINDYVWYSQSANTIIKYNNTDNLSALTLSDDAAYQITSGECCIPTKEQFEELLSEVPCTFDSSTQCFVFSKNGKSLYFRANGFANNGSIEQTAKLNYISNTAYMNNENVYKKDYILYATNTNSNPIVSDSYRFFGMHIKPVKY